MFNWIAVFVKWLFHRPMGICEWCGEKVADDERECEDCWWYRQW